MPRNGRESYSAAWQNALAAQCLRCRAHADSLLKAARKGEVVVLDVRPAEEYLAAHLPFARSIPLGELRQRLAELPKDRFIVAYCRGPYCLMANDAVELLKREGYAAIQMRDGVAEWGLLGSR